ncbi:MAG: IclR family transcriptional regulator [Actinomycetota bacterium]|nr:IclR family transcriptional regulator [Actinomycetota bacterium]
MDTVSGVGVLDKAFAVVGALEAGPLSLADLVTVTGLSRATAHRLAVALEVHEMVARADDGRFGLGPRLTGLSLPVAARPALEHLRDETGESVQLYVRRGDRRLCVASLESPHGLRTIVAVGASLPLSVGSAGKVLRGDPESLRRGWAQSVEEREPGVASVSAPVADGAGGVLAAVSVSGPIGRTTRSPGGRYAAAVTRAAAEVEGAFGRGRPASVNFSLPETPRPAVG